MTDSARHARVIGAPVLAIWFNVGTMGLAEQANQAQSIVRISGLSRVDRRPFYRPRDPDHCVGIPITGFDPKTEQFFSMQWFVARPGPPAMRLFSAT